MVRKMQADILADTKQIFSVRERASSFKMYKTPEEEFIVVRKYYILKFCYKKEFLKFENFYEAEDFILQNTSGFVRINYPANSIF